MRLSHVVLVVLLALAAVQIAYYYPQLPAVVAGHFGASGQPNAWQSKEAFFGFLGVIYVLFAALYWSVPHLILTMPASLINLPNKAYWLAPVRRAHTARVVGDQLSLLGAAQIGFMILVGQLAIQANLPGSSGALSPAIWGFLVAFVVFFALWTVRFVRMMRVSSNSR